MKRLLILVPALILLIPAFVKRADIKSYYLHFIEKTYSSLSDASLEELKSKNDAKLKSFLETQDKMKQNWKSESDIKLMNSISEQIPYLERMQEGMENEMRVRRFITEKARWMRLSLAATPALAFALVLIFIYSLIPKRKKAKVVQAEYQDPFRPQPENKPVAAPFNKRIIRNETSKADVMQLLGKPDHRTIFTDLEAWTYLYRMPGNSNEPQDPSLPKPMETVIVIFHGNLVFDFSQEVLIADRAPSQIY